MNKFIPFMWNVQELERHVSNINTVHTHNKIKIKFKSKNGVEWYESILYLDSYEDENFDWYHYSVSQL